MIAFKVLTPTEWDAFTRDGDFAGAPVDLADGFIHLSTADQLDETLRRHFAGVPLVMIIGVDLETLGAVVKWEESRGGALFPHVYGSLPISSVVSSQSRALAT